MKTMGGTYSESREDYLERVEKMLLREAKDLSAKIDAQNSLSEEELLKIRLKVLNELTYL